MARNKAFLLPSLPIPLGLRRVAILLLLMIVLTQEVNFNSVSLNIALVLFFNILLQNIAPRTNNLRKNRIFNKAFRQSRPRKEVAVSSENKAIAIEDNGEDNFYSLGWAKWSEWSSCSKSVS